LRERTAKRQQQTNNKQQTTNNKQQTTKEQQQQQQQQQQQNSIGILIAIRKIKTQVTILELIKNCTLGVYFRLW